MSFSSILSVFTVKIFSLPHRVYDLIPIQFFPILTAADPPQIGRNAVEFKQLNKSNQAKNLGYRINPERILVANNLMIWESAAECFQYSKMLWNWYNKVTNTEEFPHYSPDFREKIVELILDKKITSTELNKTLKISTIHQWIKKYKETESLERNPGSGKKTKIDNPDFTKKELGQLYGGES